MKTARKTQRKPTKKAAVSTYQHTDCIRNPCPFPGSCRKDARGCMNLENDKHPKD